jgi:hypothetical protein
LHPSCRRSCGTGARRGAAPGRSCVFRSCRRFSPPVTPNVT